MPARELLLPSAKADDAFMLMHEFFTLLLPAASQRHSRMQELAIDTDTARAEASFSNTGALAR